MAKNRPRSRKRRESGKSAPLGERNSAHKSSLAKTVTFSDTFVLADCTVLAKSAKINAAMPSVDPMAVLAVGPAVASVHGAIVQIQKDVATLRSALSDLLGFYDRVLAGHDHHGWSVPEILRLAEIRCLAARAQKQ